MISPTMAIQFTVVTTTMKRTLSKSARNLKILNMMERKAFIE